MALLPKIPWTDIDDTRVAVDAPVSTDLWTDTVIDLNYLKSVVSDGALAVADINANLVTAVTLQVNGNANITGTLSTGVFYSTEQLLWLFAF